MGQQSSANGMPGRLVMVESRHNNASPTMHEKMQLEYKDNPTPVHF